VTAAIRDIIKNLHDSDSSQIDITCTNGQNIRLNCIYKESHAPEFFLIFPPKKLPEDIDTATNCPVTIRAAKAPVSFSAQIIKIVDDRTLELIAKQTIKLESLREYFRVDTNVTIIASYDPLPRDGENLSWMIKGRTLDMSGSGILALLPEPPKNNHKIDITLTLADGKTSVSCLGHVVRKKRLRRGRYQVAFHFDSLTPKNRDDIISFCLQEQRTRLREKIETAG
jgi:c-di-GMP-binding flagellar brake protein YcgR